MSETKKEYEERYRYKISRGLGIIATSKKANEEKYLRNMNSSQKRGILYIRKAFMELTVKKIAGDLDIPPHFFSQWNNEERVYPKVGGENRTRNDSRSKTNKAKAEAERINILALVEAEKAKKAEAGSLVPKLISGGFGKATTAFEISAIADRDEPLSKSYTRDQISHMTKEELIAYNEQAKSREMAALRKLALENHDMLLSIGK